LAEESIRKSEKLLRFLFVQAFVFHMDGALRMAISLGRKLGFLLFDMLGTKRVNCEIRVFRQMRVSGPCTLGPRDGTPAGWRGPIVLH